MNAQEARENPPVFFRRALKIVDGSDPEPRHFMRPGSLRIDHGVREPGVYPGRLQRAARRLVEWDSVAAAVAADAMTLLSDNWNDVNSFVFPYNAGSRNAVQTAYRVALIAGKGIPFAQPAGAAAKTSERTEEFTTS